MADGWDFYKRECPACHRSYRPGAFTDGGLCLCCHAEARHISGVLAKKLCANCQHYKDPQKFDRRGYCDSCAAEFNTQVCSVCVKDYPAREVIKKEKICIYCAFKRGTEADMVRLRFLVRSDLKVAEKLIQYVQAIRHEKIA